MKKAQQQGDCTKCWKGGTAILSRQPEPAPTVYYEMQQHQGTPRMYEYGMLYPQTVWHG